MRRKVITIIKAAQTEVTNNSSGFGLSGVGKNQVALLRKHFRENRKTFHFDLAASAPDICSLETCSQVLKGSLLKRVVYEQLLDSGPEMKLNSEEILSKYKEFKINSPEIFNGYIKDNKIKSVFKSESVLRRVEFEIPEKNILIVAKQRVVLSLLEWVLKNRIFNGIEGGLKMNLTDTGISQIILTNKYCLMKEFDITPHLL